MYVPLDADDPEIGPDESLSGITDSGQGEAWTRMGPVDFTYEQRAFDKEGREVPVRVMELPR